MAKYGNELDFEKFNGKLENSQYIQDAKKCRCTIRSFLIRLQREYFPHEFTTRMNKKKMETSVVDILCLRLPRDVVGIIMKYLIPTEPCWPPSFRWVRECPIEFQSGEEPTRFVDGEPLFLKDNDEIWETDPNYPDRLICWFDDWYPTCGHTWSEEYCCPYCRTFDAYEDNDGDDDDPPNSTMCKTCARAINQEEKDG
jgi:hypothetical protein